MPRCVLSLLSFIEALQILIIVVLIFSFFPIPIPVFAQKLFPLSQYDVRLEREGLFYHLWIFVSLGLQALMIYFNRKRLSTTDLNPKFLPYIGVMASLVMIQIFAAFKIFLWGNPGWARDLLYASIGMGLLARIFWPELWRLLVAAWHSSNERTIPRWGYGLMDAGVIVLLSFLVFTPHLSEVLARMFSYDKFYHLDGFVLSPAWAHHQGMVLNRDVISEYSLIMPIVFDHLMQWAGGFSYRHALVILIVSSAGYYFLLYGLWRYWTKSFWLSFFAIVLSIKLQFFHWGVTPLIWIYPNATPIRFLPDVFFLFFLLRFTQDLRYRWLLAAAVINGLSLVWTMDVGIYMFGTLLLAAGFLVYFKRTSILQVVALIAIPFGIVFSILSIFYGPLLFQASFWQNTFEFSSLFLQGWGSLPITDGLKDKQFFAFLHRSADSGDLLRHIIV